MDEKITYASAKPTTEIFALFEYAQKLDVNGLGKAEILERAEHYLVENKDKINFKNLSKSKLEINFSGALPSSFKVRINNRNLDAEVNKILKDSYNINRIMTPFKLRVVLSAYVIFLQNSEENVSKPDFSIHRLKTEAISIVDRKSVV